MSSECLHTRTSRDIPIRKQFCENMKILVVGAGLAGLAATSSLYEKGFTNIIILEAQEDIGGRVLSLPLGKNATSYFLLALSFIFVYLCNHFQ